MDEKYVKELLRRTDVKDGGKTILCGLCEQTFEVVLSSEGERERSEVGERAR